MMTFAYPTNDDICLPHIAYSPNDDIWHYWWHLLTPLMMTFADPTYDHICLPANNDPLMMKFADPTNDDISYLTNENICLPR
jgi:hypothetical protein